ncbi:MAG: hypothetical protein WKG07_27505 [Hymenobacter sp.]
MPVRLAIGAPRPRRRHRGSRPPRYQAEAATCRWPTVVDSVDQLLNDIQVNIYEKAKRYRDAHTTPRRNLRRIQDRARRLPAASW